MVDRTNILAQFSSALVERSVAANSAIAAIRLREGRHMTGMLWRPDAVITSEQSLPERETRTRDRRRVGDQSENGRP